MTMMRKSIILLLLAVITHGIYAQKDDTHDFNVAKNLDVFNSIYKYLDMMYVDTLDADEVIGNGINGMLRSLDPYTVYYPEDKVKELYGIKVQVANADDSALADNGITITAAGK